MGCGWGRTSARHLGPGGQDAARGAGCLLHTQPGVPRPVCSDAPAPPLLPVIMLPTILLSESHRRGSHLHSFCHLISRVFSNRRLRTRVTLVPCALRIQPEDQQTADSPGGGGWLRLPLQSQPVPVLHQASFDRLCLPSSAMAAAIMQCSMSGDESGMDGSHEARSGCCSAADQGGAAGSDFKRNGTSAKSVRGNPVNVNWMQVHSFSGLYTVTLRSNHSPVYAQASENTSSQIKYAGIHANLICPAHRCHRTSHSQQCTSLHLLLLEAGFEIFVHMASSTPAGGTGRE